MSLILYSYWRSSAAYRVRIALNYLGIEHEVRPLALVGKDSDKVRADYRKLNPQGLVPTLVDGEVVLTQSQAILEYLAEKYPAPALLPADPVERAHARQVAAVVCADIHPLNNLRVMQYLENVLHADQETRDDWYRHWIIEGFRALEVLLKPGAGPYCLGDDVTIADCCLIPQVYNAHRFLVPLEDFPTLAAIEQACLKLDAFDKARPENQSDAPESEG
jgi:maleylacetoacetate isomerase